MMMIPPMTINSTPITTARSFLTTLQKQVPSFLNEIAAVLREEYGLDVSDYHADHVCWRTESWEEYTQLIRALKEEEVEEEGQQQSIGDGKNLQQQPARKPIFRLLIESDIGGRPISTFELAKGSLFVDDNKESDINDGCSDGNNRTNNADATSTVTSLTPALAPQQQMNHRHHVSVIEIPSPKPGSYYPSGLEHVEFILPYSSAMTTDNYASHHHHRYHDDTITPRNDNRHQSAFDTLMKQYPTIRWNLKATSKALNPDISLQIPLYDEAKTVTKSSSSLTSTILRTRICSVKFHLIPLADVIAYEKIINNATGEYPKR
jgi:predicted metalloenzyme YecM